MAKTFADTLTCVETETPVKTEAVTLAVVEAYPYLDTLNKVEAEALVYTQAHTFQQVQAKSVTETRSDMEIETLVDTLTDASRVDGRTLGERLGNVEAEALGISLVFWATELDTSLSSSICQQASINKSTSANRARYGFIEIDILTGLDEQIDLGKPSSICRYRARIVEHGKPKTLTFPGGQVECYRAR